MKKYHVEDAFNAFEENADPFVFRLTAEEVENLQHMANQTGAEKAVVKGFREFINACGDDPNHSKTEGSAVWLSSAGNGEIHFDVAFTRTK